MKLKIIGVLLLIATIFYIGCRKSDRDEDTLLIASVENAYAERVFNKVFLLVHEFAIDDSLIGLLPTASRVNALETCLDSVTMEATSGGFPKMVEFHYPVANVSCEDGKTKRGSVNAKFSGGYHNTFTTVKVIFTNFAYNNWTVSGTMILNYKGVNVNNRKKFSFEIQNGLITGDSLNIEYNCDRTLTQSAGHTTSTFTDDIFMLTGTATGRITDGSSYAVNITTPLTFSAACNNIYAGVCEVVPNGLSTRTIDWGSGCDGKATVTINGVESSFTLD